MRKINLKAVLVFSSLVFVLAYIFLGARPLSQSFGMEPEWIVDIISDSGGGDSPRVAVDDRRIPYKLGQVMGYFTPRGDIRSRVTFPYHASISADYYTSFLQDARETEFFRGDGSVAGTIDESGFPYFDEDRIFLFRPGGAAFSFVNPDGSLAWTYEGYAPIVAFSSSRAGIAAGYADGVIRVFDFSGAMREIEPGGSEYPVILGVAISPDGSKIASISGISRQRFTLTRIDDASSGGNAKVLFHRYLENEVRSRSQVRFNRQGTSVYYESDGTLCVFDIAAGATTEIPIGGRLLSVAESDRRHGENLVFALSKNGAAYTVWVLEKFSNLIGSFSFNADHAFISADVDNAVYIGKDRTISKINVIRK